MFFIVYFSEESPGYRSDTATQRKTENPKEIILIGGGTGWDFTDRPFATHFGYTPIYKSIATYMLESNW